MSIVYSGSNTDGSKFEVRRSDDNQDFGIFMTFPDGHKSEQWVSVWSADPNNLSKVYEVLKRNKMIGDIK
jgi:hypothetical protein